MRIFVYEIKNLWNWRVLLAIAAFGALSWFAFLADGLDSYESLKFHGVYGSYQTEMFRLYGETLESEEWEDFDIPGKLAEVYAAGDVIIAKEPVFAKYRITSFDEYLNWRNSESYWSIIDNTVIDAAAQEDTSVMDRALNEDNPDQTLDEWYASPMDKIAESKSP